MKQNNYSLYIHVPFCEKKCGYCSFYSEVLNNDNKSQKEISWLNEINNQAKYLFKKLSLHSKNEGIFIRTLYIGGGTPSILSKNSWESLFCILRKYFDFSNCLEATVECNPNSINEFLLDYLKAQGITRISLGVQSLVDDELKILERIHNSKIAMNAIKLVKEKNFDLNVDLIFSIPGQTIRSFDYSIREVIKYANHISVYQLTLEPDSKLYSKFGNHDFNKSGYYFYRYAQYILNRKGFIQYEISNFAQKGKECLHNISYWNQSEVIALGKAASGYLKNIRYRICVNGKIEIEKLSLNERSRECAILLLRTKFGINKKNFIAKFGQENFNHIENILNNMPDDLFIKNKENISLSNRGMRVGNAIWQEII